MSMRSTPLTFSLVSFVDEVEDVKDVYVEPQRRIQLSKGEMDHEEASRQVHYRTPVSTSPGPLPAMTEHPILLPDADKIPSPSDVTSKPEGSLPQEPPELHTDLKLADSAEATKLGNWDTPSEQSNNVFGKGLDWDVDKTYPWQRPSYLEPHSFSPNPSQLWKPHILDSRFSQSSTNVSSPRWHPSWPFKSNEQAYLFRHFIEVLAPWVSDS